ncbi:unnamed protein product [Protopolystoma xenopodis]|uniref:Uncharacterized protein n=1 Tax=Protopolystoma xenopodis TaxID=117903 RepID=A0A3S4ZTB9_9PLAT|nr:unnamed protein product [Protopolystoma xenopodis]
MVLNGRASRPSQSVSCRPLAVWPTDCDACTIAPASAGRVSSKDSLPLGPHSPVHQRFASSGRVPSLGTTVLALSRSVPFEPNSDCLAAQGWQSGGRTQLPLAPGYQRTPLSAPTLRRRTQLLRQVPNPPHSGVASGKSIGGLVSRGSTHNLRPAHPQLPDRSTRPAAQPRTRLLRQPWSSSSSISSVSSSAFSTNLPPTSCQPLYLTGHKTPCPAPTHLFAPPPSPTQPPILPYSARSVCHRGTVGPSCRLAGNTPAPTPAFASPSSSSPSLPGSFHSKHAPSSSLVNGTCKPHARPVASTPLPDVMTTVDCTLPSRRWLPADGVNGYGVRWLGAFDRSDSSRSPISSQAGASFLRLPAAVRRAQTIDELKRMNAQGIREFTEPEGGFMLICIPSQKGIRQTTYVWK